MQKFREQTTFKIITFLLVMTLMVPSAVKVAHIWSHLHHEVCNGEPQAHFHTADLDCNFYNFQLSAPFTVPTIEFVFFQSQDNHPAFTTIYSFLSEFQQLHFSLRGPPQIDFI